jgi:hypothetical protein
MHIESTGLLDWSSILGTGEPLTVLPFFQYGLYHNKTDAAVKLRPVHPMLQHEKYDNLGIGARLAKRKTTYLSFRDVKTLNRVFDCKETCM